MAGSDLHGARHGLSSLLSAEYLYHHAINRMDNQPPDKGASIPAITQALSNNGQPEEIVWPYLTSLPEDINEWIPPPECGELWRADITFQRGDVDAIISTINNKHGVILCLSLTQNFYHPDAAGIIWDKTGDISTPHKHAVIGVAVGTDMMGTPFVLIRNSWGKNWGMDGYAWISKSYLQSKLIWHGFF